VIIYLTDTITKLKLKATTRKGRGFAVGGNDRERFQNFETIPAAKDDFPDSEAQRSVEGYILICTGLHEESHEVIKKHSGTQKSNITLYLESYVYTPRTKGAVSKHPRIFFLVFYPHKVRFLT